MTEPAPWTQIYNRVKSQIPAAPDALIRNEVWSVMIDFTQDTNIWVEEIPFTIQPNQVLYPVTVTHGLPHRLLLVYNVDPNNMYNGDRYKWADNGITMRIPGTIQLYRNPVNPQNWMAVIAKSVLDGRFDTTVTPPVLTGYPEIDDWIVEGHADCIYYGLMFFLQRMSSKPFGNPTSARENQLLYNSQKSKARVDNIRTNVFGAQSWQYPQGYQAITRKGWT